MNRVTALAQHAVRFEIGVWRSLFRWVTGRDPGAPEDAERSPTVHDHLVQADGVRLRLGFALDLTVPWDAIEKIVTKERHRSGIRAVQLDESGAALHLVMGSRTNLDLVLATPTVVELPRGPATVTTIHFFADEPRALLGRVRQEIRAQ